jgi:DNA polymerase sigma
MKGQMIDPNQLLRVTERLRKRKEKARHDAFIRALRTEILLVLYEIIPRQENMKRRTNLIDNLADKLTDLFEEHYAA